MLGFEAPMYAPPEAQSWLLVIRAVVSRNLFLWKFAWDRV